MDQDAKRLEMEKRVVKAETRVRVLDLLDDMPPPEVEEDAEDTGHIRSDPQTTVRRQESEPWKWH